MYGRYLISPVMSFDVCAVTVGLSPSAPQLLLAERKLNEAAPLLQQGGPLIDAWQDNHQQKEYLKVGACR